MIWNNPEKHIHCIGIGGCGVSAIAELLLDKGFHVSGSNLKPSAVADRLRTKGAKIAIGHDAANVVRVDACVYSSAISEENPELQACRDRGIPCFKRGEALAHLMHQYPKSIGIAGTHGKTTTTSLVAWLLLQAGKNPAYAVGGNIIGEDHHAYAADGDYFVAELDESDATFLFAKPSMAIVTNIDHDHLVTYDHSFDKLVASFAQFLEHIDPNGMAIIGGDSAQVAALAISAKIPTQTYGFTDHVDWCITDFKQHQMMIDFTLSDKTGATVTFHAPLIGRHNASNATAAILMARHCGIDDATIQAGLTTFPGVERRLNYQGTMHCESGDVAVYDDYGHHPQAMRSTFEALKEAFPEQRIVCVFQPHRYTRTQDCFGEFVDVLRLPDIVLLMPIYAASEAPIPGVTSLALELALRQTGQSVVGLAKDAIPVYMHDHLQAGDIVIFQGAGDLLTVAKAVATPA